jgi:excisionase family DNA binding protein
MPHELSFYTVAEAAEVLRVDAATIYRAIRAGAFPAVRIRTRYVVPAAALRDLAEEAMRLGSCVDLGTRIRDRRLTGALAEQEDRRGTRTK